ncbi:hypothetical protein [Acidovorax sp. sic0104]|uniref:hypothetical protein n=1 Tax=Acidovorax sp. sic0104 TaxID=2854784 RepID=UPI001C48DA84|nr:hypothetical protein [Acidovorax sp. sic0104]MBV7542122.1 hypothetical protein [Acidovorax sp. sic0104]
MQSKPFSRTLINLALVASLTAATGLASAAGISDFLQPSKTGSTAAIKATEVSPNDKDVPDWLRNSDRLNAMMGASADARLENAKVIRKVESPIPGLDGFVVQADSFSSENPEGRQELFVFYTDKSRRYLVVGMMIDMEKDRDMNQLVERYVRGEMADNPARALRPQDMHAMVLKGGKSKSIPLTFVVDLGPDAGKSSFLSVVGLHQSLVKSGASPRPIRIVPVSAGKDELSTGAMAIAMGYERLSGEGVEKLVEFAQRGRSTSWMEPTRLKKDEKLKRAVGTGIFQIDENSTQALLARLTTLPLVYDGEGDRVKPVPLPNSQADWKALLLK